MLRRRRRSRAYKVWRRALYVSALLILTVLSSWLLSRCHNEIPAPSPHYETPVSAGDD